MQREENSYQERRLKQCIKDAEYQISRLKRELDMTPTWAISYRGKNPAQLRNLIWQKEREIEEHKAKLWKIR